MTGYKRSNDPVTHPVYLFGVFYALQQTDHSPHHLAESRLCTTDHESPEKHCFAGDKAASERLACTAHKCTLLSGHTERCNRGELT